MIAAQTVSFDLYVHYSQAYLVDDTDDAMGPNGMLDDHPTHRVGIIRVEDGDAFLITGLHTGTVDFSVTVADHDPGADSGGYEDIVEISMESEAGRFALHEWGGGDVHELPDLPAGPGWYRLRYHAQNMDAAAEADTSQEIIDRYLLQIWPQDESEPRVVQSASGQLAYWRSPR
ncbi:hypothetical protein [Herbidospora sp. NBRC 101105]|uniref:hypothetical protein n=1 Tax=Herbidospora sp. NBRC 101105 TaxID=3032195 RepID=UPI0024A518FD|nr:hypothetical protein [Herbidospora sp. NBRC 101105]GLX98000.1 hypothetical protein Hesp01_59500 [Herbidospora sp. NBRC 101105]